jgi:hypothetical protein
MPKAAVNEDCDVFTGKDKIRFAKKVHLSTPTRNFFCSQDLDES